MLSRITDVSSSPRGKWIVIAIWLIAAVVIVPLTPALADVIENDSATFLPDGAESTQVLELVEERFPSDTTPVIVVFRSDDGLSEAETAAADDLGQWARGDDAPEAIDPNAVVSVFTVPQAAEGLVSEDGTTMTMVIGITGDTNGESYQEAVRAIREEVADPPDGLGIAVSGPGGLIVDLLAVFERIDLFLTLVTAGLVLVLLIVIYRSPVVALVPLVSVGWVFTLTGSIAAVGAERFGLPVNGQAQGIATVLLFGAGTDYCLFVSSRYREELRRHEDRHDAMRATMRGVGEAIASSAGTVLVATVVLSFAVLRSTAALGPLLSVAIGLMLVAGLTLVPAILTVLGRKSFWPLSPKLDSSASAAADASHTTADGLWGTVARRVTTRPVGYLVAWVAVFAVFSLGLLQYRVTYDPVTSLPDGAESRIGFEWLQESFPAGESAPIEVYVTLGEGETVRDRLTEIDAFTARLAEYDGVAFVQSVTAPLGTNGPIGGDAVAAAWDAVPEPVRAEIDAGEGGPPQNAAGTDPALAEAIGVYASTRAFLSPDNGVVRLDVVLEESPYEIAQIEGIGAFREFARAAAEDAGLDDTVLIGGEAAVSFDTDEANSRDTLVIIPAILIAIGVILALLLRSLVAPLYLLGTIGLSYVATLGLSTFLFLNVFGNDGIGASVGLFLFVFLVALGVDYNIYLMARVREETAHRELRQGVEIALSRTGGVITSAGIILAGTFGALMILPLRDLFQLGFAVAIGVLLDTFIIRSVMVPAIVVLLGRWNWWPGRRFRDA